MINFKSVLTSALLIAGVSITNAQSGSGTYSWNNLPKVTEPVFKKDTFKIENFGAKPDGITLNTKAINDAIDACSKKGGGVVLVRQGLWLTGPIVMKSNVNLCVRRDAMVLFTDDFNQYPLVEGNWEGKRSARNQSPISGTNLTNVAITGEGIIDGNGEVWRTIGKDRLTESQWKKKVASGGIVSDDGKRWYPSAKSKKAQENKLNGDLEGGKTLTDFEDIKDYLRPNMVVFTNCKKVLLQGITVQNSPAWCLHPLMCEDLTLRDVHVRNPEWAANGDGIDVESCRNVLIENSTFDAGDDGICIKSGRDEEGRKRGIPTENVIIRKNIVYKAHGGFVIGSEMSGGARNIFVYDCLFDGTDIGLRFKTARGRGGVVENIYVKDIAMKDIVRDAIFFDMYYFMKPPTPGEKVEVPAVTEATPQFRNFYINNIVCNGAERGIFVRGLPEMSIKNIWLNDIVLKTKTGIEAIEANNINFKNIQLVTSNTKPVIYVENSSALTFDNIKYNNGADLLLSINGAKTGNIKLINTDESKAKKKVEYGNGATQSSVAINSDYNKF
jgi:polygalacturonase